MTRIKMHIYKTKLSFYPPSEIKCRLQNKVSTLICHGHMTKVSTKGL